METYAFYPPQLQSTRLPYQVLRAGSPLCRHELRDEDWRDRIAVENGVVFVTFSCRHCGRRICQSLDEVVPPWTLPGHAIHHTALRAAEVASTESFDRSLPPQAEQQINHTQSS